MIVFGTIELQVYGLRLVAGELVTGLIKIGHQRGILICCHRTFEFDSGTHNCIQRKILLVYTVPLLYCATLILRHSESVTVPSVLMLWTGLHITLPTSLLMARQRKGSVLSLLTLDVDMVVC